MRAKSWVFSRMAATVLLACSVWVSGCKGLMQASKDAEGLDAGFHNAMKGGNWAQLYSDADPGLREDTSQEDFAGLFSAIQRKLGDPVSFQQTSWRLNAETSGTYLESECQTVFSRNAKGIETFKWKKSGDRYRLYSYNINSNALITR